MLHALAVILLATATFVWPTPPPPAPVKPVTNDYFGTKLVDSYQYIEKLTDPGVQSYIRDQADYTNSVLAKLGPGREKLRADITRLADAGSAVFSVSVVGPRIFYLERPPGVNDARLMVRDNPTSTPRMLLDPDALAQQMGSKAHFSISTYVPSPDGAHIAVGIVPGGAEADTHTRVVSVASGTLLAEDLPRTWFGVTDWTPDSKAFFYNQLPELKPGESENDRELRSLTYVHVLGATGADSPVFGINLDPKIPFVPIDIPIVLGSPVSTYAVGENNHGVQNELTLYVAPVKDVVAGAAIPWRKVADVDDDVTGIDFHGTTLYMLTHKDASRYKVTAIDMSRPDQTAANAVTVVPAGDNVIQQVAAAGDGLYMRGILGGIATLRRVPFVTTTSGPTNQIVAAPTDITLPFAGTLREFATDPRVPGAALGLVSWTKPLLIYSLDVQGTITDTGIRKPPNIDTSNYTSVEVKAKSADGTLVPLSIVMRRGTKLNGSNPTYIEAYGAYGINEDPYFLGTRFAWLDAGGIWAVAHVRGGGEYGEDWHVAGKGPTKQHTIDDAVAAAHYLIEQHYTSPAHLAIEGTSAGGIMIGGAITQHPELFAGALDVVGLTDSLRSEAADPNGNSNVPEFGSVKTQDGFKGLYVMDAYQHIVDGRKYPAVMAATGINDPRVAPWHPVKFIARLQAATTSGRPVLLRVDYDAGHGMLNTSRKQTISLLTDEFSFLLWQCGSPLFEGIPTMVSGTTRMAR